jgi:hypothetical protein
MGMLTAEKENKEGNKYEPEPVLSFTDVHAAYKPVKPFFYMFSSGKHDK